MKNSELSNEEIAAVEEVAVKCAALLYHRLQQFSDPREYSRKILSKILQSNKDIVSALILKYVINNTSNELMTPSELNAEITSYLQKNGIFDTDDGNSNRSTDTDPKKYLVPRDLTLVLKNLKKKVFILIFKVRLTLTNIIKIAIQADQKNLMLLKMKRMEDHPCIKSQIG